MKVICDRCAVLGVQICINLIKDIERCWIGSLNGEYQGKTAETWKFVSKRATPMIVQLTLLSTTQLLNALLVIMLAVETHTDAHTSVVLNTFLVRFTLTVFVFRFLVCSAIILLSLDDQSTLPSRNQLGENLSKGFADLLESPLDRFVFALIKDLDQLSD